MRVRKRGLYGRLDILRIIVLPAHDDTFLQAAGNIQVPTQSESEIARAQEPAAEAADGSGENTLALGRLVPIALRHPGAGYPDLSYFALAARSVRLGVGNDDRGPLVDSSATHNWQSARVQGRRNDLVRSQGGGVRQNMTCALPRRLRRHFQSRLRQSVCGAECA